MSMEVVKDSKLMELLGVPSVSLVTGARGKGKTAFGFRALQIALHHGLKPYMLGLPRQKWHLLPDWITPVETPVGISDNSAVFLDEAYMYLFAREFSKSFNRMMVKLIGVTRQRNQLFLFTTHLCRKLDVGCVFDCDNVVFRKPSFLHARMERVELRPMIEEAEDFFKKLEGDPKRYAYVINEAGAFAVHVELPPFWTEELGRAFSEVVAVPEKEPGDREREVLEKVLEIEEKGGYDRKFGWQIGEVPGLSGGLLTKFLSMGLVFRGYTSKSSKHFYGDAEKIREFLGKSGFSKIHV